MLSECKVIGVSGMWYGRMECREKDVCWATRSIFSKAFVPLRWPHRSHQAYFDSYEVMATYSLLSKSETWTKEMRCVVQQVERTQSCASLTRLLESAVREPTLGERGGMSTAQDTFRCCEKDRRKQFAQHDDARAMWLTRRRSVLKRWHFFFMFPNWRCPPADAEFRCCVKRISNMKRAKRKGLDKYWCRFIVQSAA